MTDQPTPGQITPEQAERIKAATISNIVKKIKKGGTPTATEAKMLEEATASPAGVVDLRTALCGPQDLADLFGYTRQRIDQLIDEGLVVKRSRGRYAVWESIKGLLLHLQTKKKNQWDGDGGADAGDYEAHRARLTAAKADVAEIAAAIAKGQAHDAGAVEAVWTDMLMNCRSKLMAIPSQLAPKLRKESDLAKVKDLLETAITKALTELASYDPAVVTNEYLSTHRVDVAPAPEVDGKPVG